MKVNLNLSQDEILMLQELVENSGENGRYQWENEICQALNTKLAEAFTKPDMSKQDFEKQLNSCEKFWKKEGDIPSIVSIMVAAKRRELEFHYNIR